MWAPSPNFLLMFTIKLPIPPYQPIFFFESIMPGVALPSFSEFELEPNMRTLFYIPSKVQPSWVDLRLKLGYLRRRIVLYRVRLRLAIGVPRNASVRVGFNKI